MVFLSTKIIVKIGNFLSPAEMLGLREGPLWGNRWLILGNTISLGCSVSRITGKGFAGPFRLEDIKAVGKAYDINRKPGQENYDFRVFDLEQMGDGYYILHYGKSGVGVVTRCYGLTRSPETQFVSVRHREIFDAVWDNNRDAYNLESQSTSSPIPGNPWFYGSPMIEAGKRIRIRRSPPPF